MIQVFRLIYRSPMINDYDASPGDFHRNTPAPGVRFPYVIII
jgi:hypothetical protein